MKKWKQILFALLASVMLLTVVPCAFATEYDTGFSDVAADAWYAGAVEYVRDNGLMSGISATTFEPDGTMTRAMLATTLYRAAGSPAVSGSDSFTDTADGAWYADAVLWASQQGVISGYGNDLFGTNDPVTREQIATILWRYAGGPSADASQDFADESEIASYAAAAVDWARANGVVGGVDGNRFLPRDNATRAQVATILRNYLTMSAAVKPEQPSEEPRVLVAYFSATGNTERVASAIAEATDGDLFELTSVEPYTDTDLNWTDEDSRVVYEHENPDKRDTELVAYTPDNWDDYDVVFVGYPIWWYDAAWPVEGFVTENDFTGKTVIPFCTSSSSGIGESGERLAGLAGTGDWLEGERFRSGAGESDVQAWIEEIGVLQRH